MSATTPTTSVADRVADLEAQAADAWARQARQARWTFWMRLSWARHVSGYTAHRHLAQWATRLQARVPGVVILVGLHTATGRCHAHALVFLPRRGAPTGPLATWLRGVATTWHTKFWPHGLLYLDHFRPWRIRGAANPRRHGAAAYLSKEVGTVELFGSPVPYDARRTR